MTNMNLNGGDPEEYPKTPIERMKDLFTAITSFFKKIGAKIPQKWRIKFIRNKKFRQSVLIALIALIIISLAASIGIYRALLQNLPDVEILEKYEPGIITYIYDDKGEIIREFAEEKRIRITYADIPETLKQAIIATEDPRFYKHSGVDTRGIVRAVWENIRNLGRGRRPHGGSTITQQLIREVFKMTKRANIRRKLKEWILALQVEKRYSKEEILTLYCNQFYLGPRLYGVETLSLKYFGKNVRDLSLVEAALVAGVFRGAGRYDPYRYPNDTLVRRNHVLNRMKEEGYITAKEAQEAQAEPMEVLPLNRYTSDFAAYFIEEVRKYITEKYGSDVLFRGGLKVYTTLNSEWQRYAEESLKANLRRLDREKEWRKDKINVIERGVENLEEISPFNDPGNPDRLRLESWFKPVIEEGDILETVVKTVERNRAEVLLKDWTGVLTSRDLPSMWGRSLSTLIKPGDVVHVKINKIDEENRLLQVSLEQEPELESAFLAIHPQSGQIKAMVGGYSYKRLKFNQATQAMRQSGSVIKPFLYTAALDNGYSPTSIFIDEPTEFPDKWMGEIYSPPNYDEKYKGACTLRMGIEQSRNMITVKVLDAISPQVGVDYVKRFGITTPIYPYLSLALGAFEVYMTEMVSAFSTFPNKGVRIEPSFISRVEDKDGSVLEEAQIRSHNIISPQLAYLMTSLLRGVVLRGTATPAASLEMNICGKTGTTDEHSDAWFMGFSPDLCAGVWVGYPEGRRTIGPRKSGAVAALPVCRDFFERIIEDKKQAAKEEGQSYVPEEFEEPPHLEYVQIDRLTGRLAGPICLSRYVFREVFLPNMKKPSRPCTYEDHMLTHDYYLALREREQD